MAAKKKGDDDQWVGFRQNEDYDITKRDDGCGEAKV